MNDIEIKIRKKVIRKRGRKKISRNQQERDGTQAQEDNIKEICLEIMGDEVD